MLSPLDATESFALVLHSWHVSLILQQVDDKMLWCLKGHANSCLLGDWLRCYFRETEESAAPTVQSNRLSISILSVPVSLLTLSNARCLHIFKVPLYNTYCGSREVDAFVWIPDFKKKHAVACILAILALIMWILMPCCCKNFQFLIWKHMCNISMSHFYVKTCRSGSLVTKQLLTFRLWNLSVLTLDA